MDIKKMRGFTLLELLIVISIIILLVGLLSPALKSVREQANKQKAKAVIASLETAISMYYTDLGSYPTQASWVTLLINGTGGYGPYMDNKDVVSGQFRDPWNHAYHYNTTTAGNVTSVNIWSDGVNGVDNSGNPDDIRN